jgi:GNAT superfamily N-acetyltransferase
MHIIGPELDRHSECESILRALPDWFGIESAIVQYVRDIENLPTFLAHNDDAHTIGFMSVRRHFPCAAELHVLAVRAEHHRRGVGRALLDRVERWLREEGVRFLQVKTLSPSRPCESYEQTRRFYEAMGFTALEEFPTLWDPRNPCLMMIKAL